MSGALFLLHFHRKGMWLWKLPPCVCCSPEASGPCERGVGWHEGARLAVLVGGWRTGAVCAVSFSPELTAWCFLRDRSRSPNGATLVASLYVRTLPF